jgi:hypothetical protein
MVPEQILKIIAEALEDHVDGRLVDVALTERAGGWTLDITTEDKDREQLWQLVDESITDMSE